jgi:hypothetical protein
MDIAPIKSNRDYRRVLKEIDGLVSARRNSPEGDRLDVRPERIIQKMPLRTRRSSTLGMPRGLFGRNGLMAVHSKSVSSYLMIRGSGSGA